MEFAVWKGKEHVMTAFHGSGSRGSSFLTLTLNTGTSWDVHQQLIMKPCAKLLKTILVPALCVSQSTIAPIHLQTASICLSQLHTPKSAKACFCMSLNLTAKAGHFLTKLYIYFPYMELHSHILCSFASQHLLSSSHSFFSVMPGPYPLNTSLCEPLLTST